MSIWCPSIRCKANVRGYFLPAYSAAVYLAAGILSSANIAQADLLILSPTESCPAIDSRLESYQQAIEDTGKLTDKQKGEFSILLHEACSPVFAHCKFDLCLSLSQRLKKDPEADSLAWLNNDHTCETLVKEIQQRFGKLGKFSELPERKKLEVGYVLDISCSSRFEQCGFKRCGPKIVDPNNSTTHNTFAKEPAQNPEPPIATFIASAQTTPSLSPNEPTAGTTTNVATEDGGGVEDKAALLAYREYERVLKEELAKRLAMIEIAVEQESKERRQWGRIGNPEELAVVEERRKRSKEENLRKDDELDVDSPGYYQQYLDEKSKSLSTGNPNGRTSSGDKAREKTGGTTPGRSKKSTGIVF